MPSYRGRRPQLVNSFEVWFVNILFFILENNANIAYYRYNTLRCRRFHGCCQWSKSCLGSWKRDFTGKCICTIASKGKTCKATSHLGNNHDPFLPMLAHGLHYAAMGFNPLRWLYTCGGNSMFTADKAIQFRVLYLLLAIPFTIVATPWYVCYVILTGCHSILWPEKAHPILKHKKALRLKFQEVVLESSLQLCLGKLWQIPKLTTP